MIFNGIKRVSKLMQKTAKVRFFIVFVVWRLC